LFTMFLMYPGVSAIVLGFFVCVKVNGAYYLAQDFTITCFESRWNNNVGFAVTTILIYPLGVPLLAFYFLNRYKKRFREPGVRLQLGFLYDGYSYDRWYFEIADMCNKLFLTSIVAFFPVNSQMPIGMVWIVSYMLLTLLIYPFVRKSDDRLHLFAQMQIFLVVLGGYFFISLENNGDFISDQDDTQMSVVLIFLTLCLVVIFSIMAIKSVRKLFRFMQDRTLRNLNEMSVKEQSGILHVHEGAAVEETTDDAAKPTPSQASQVESPESPIPQDPPQDPPLAGLDDPVKSSPQGSQILVESPLPEDDAS